MIVKTELADNTIEIFETNNYKISTIKDMHPMIVSVSVFAAGKLIKKIRRPFSFIYRHFIFKSYKIQSLLKELNDKNTLSS